MPSAAPAVLLHSLHTQQGVCNIVFAMTRRDFVKPAFSLRKKRSVKTHALSLLGTTRLLSRSDRLANPGKYLQLLDADTYNPGCYGNYDSIGFNSVSQKLDPCGIINARAFGYGVNVWTCNDKDEMRQLIAAGVTGLFSDFPNRVLDVLEE